MNQPAIIETFGSTIVCNDELLFEYNSELGRYGLRWSHDPDIMSTHATLAETLRAAADIVEANE